MKCNKDEIFVYASNEAGIHSAGSAFTARAEYGASWGKGNGLSGKSYGIPTRDKYLHVLPLPTIESYIQQFIQFATDNPQMKFCITPIGTGISGFTCAEIAPMFKDLPPNCRVPQHWREYVTYSIHE